MTVSGAAAEITVAATPTVPTASARRVEEGTDEDGTDVEGTEVELLERADMMTSHQ
jgi:hypothetical protein